ncbi:unnamed protein product [Urochloa decumbens]|uniref:CCHC-type domain-containing protein n=1 Tax=Urochloa decumbens TaxID=240449 RepID=A0ABC9G3K0_9POAL
MESSSHDTTPPLPPAGDPPAANQSTPRLPGDPPAANASAPLPAAFPARAAQGAPPSRSGSGKAVELHYQPSASASPGSANGVNRKQDLVAESNPRAEVTGRSELRPGASYKEALVGVRTFKPRFDSSKRPEEWNDNSKKHSSAKTSVWGRLGPRPSVHDRLGARVPLGQQQAINGYLQILKAKAIGRCYNCFASDHRIASCRDPPKCLLCSRFGHKARYCPRPPSTAASVLWRRRAPDEGPPAGSAAPSPAAATAPMNFIPGESWRRPAKVSACAARTAEVRDADRDLLLHALVAVQIDARAQLTCEGVLRDALQQLRIPSSALQVSKISTSMFLLRFQSPAVRNAALARRALVAGHTSLHLMPWGRQVSAAAALGHLYYRARVCLEGVPGHAHQVESVLHLLPKQSFVEGIDFVREREDEKGCFILWIWCQDPDAISILGNLQLEEPMAIPEDHDITMSDYQFPVLRSEEVSMLSYDILIHLDLVEDYHPPPRSPSRGSFESDISGIPADDTTAPWPERHRFHWHLGQPDAMPDPPRTSVHARLGARRDRSPPRDGGARGAGAGGFRQMPPPNQHDLARSTFGAARTTRHRNGASGYQGRQRNQGVNIEPLDVLFVSADAQDTQTKIDPMLMEASLPLCAMHSLPKSSQRSVEPTVTERAPAVRDLLTGDIEAEADIDGVMKNSSVDNVPANASGLLGAEKPQEGAVLQSTPGMPTKRATAFDLLTSPGSSEPLFGKMFDLNQEWENWDFQQASAENMLQDQLDTLAVGDKNTLHSQLDGLDANGTGKEDCADRISLGPAEARLNKQGKDHPGHKTGIKGIARLAVPLKKTLLCTPIHKPKIPQNKKNNSIEDAVQLKRNSKGPCLAIDEQAATLLMKTSGALGASELPSEMAQEKFGKQFVTPLHVGTVGDMRKAFGLSDTGADVLEALVCEADDNDD